MTNEPMTEQELREIEGLAAAATDGEWRAVDKGNTVPSHAVMYYGIGVKPVNIASGISPSTGNAAFIAVSRLAVPQMAAEIRRAWALIQKIYEVADEERFLEVTAVIDAENGGTHE